MDQNSTTPSTPATSKALETPKTVVQKIQRKLIETLVFFDLVFKVKTVPWGRGKERVEKIVGKMATVRSFKLNCEVEVRPSVVFDPVPGKSYAVEVAIWQLPPRKEKGETEARYQGVATVLPEFKVSSSELRRAEDLRALVTFRKEGDGILAHMPGNEGMVILPVPNWQELTGAPVPVGNGPDGKPQKVLVQLVEDVNKCWGLPQVGETVNALTVLQGGITATEFLQDRMMTLSEPFEWEHFRSILKLGGGDFNRKDVREARNRELIALHPDRIPLDSPAYSMRIQLCQRQSGRVVKAVAKAFAYLDRQEAWAKAEVEKAAMDADPQCVQTAASTGQRCQRQKAAGKRFCSIHCKVVERMLEAEVGVKVGAKE